MQIDILTPETKLFSDKGSSIKLPGLTGGLELLENHAPIIVALKKGEIKIVSNGKTHTIEIEDGFAECFNNTVSVLIAGGKIVK